MHSDSCETLSWHSKKHGTLINMLRKNTSVDTGSADCLVMNTHHPGCKSGNFVWLDFSEQQHLVSELVVGSAYFLCQWEMRSEKCWLRADGVEGEMVRFFSIDLGAALPTEIQSLTTSHCLLYRNCSRLRSFLKTC